MRYGGKPEAGAKHLQAPRNQTLWVLMISIPSFPCGRPQGPSRIWKEADTSLRDPAADAETYVVCRRSRITRIQPGLRLCRSYRAATQELTIGFSESELARENGAAGLAKTELRRLGANK